MHNQGFLAAQFFKHLRYRLCQPRSVNAKQVCVRGRRVSQRTQDVKYGPDPYFFAWGNCVLHGWVKSRGEHETDTDLLNCTLNLLRIHVQVESQLFEHVCAAASA